MQPEQQAAEYQSTDQRPAEACTVATCEHVDSVDHDQPDGEGPDPPGGQALLAKVDACEEDRADEQPGQGGDGHGGVLCQTAGRAASAARAAASMAATGASNPVQSEKARAAWKSSIERPPWASIPCRRRAANQGVSSGW